MQRIQPKAIGYLRGLIHGNRTRWLAYWLIASLFIANASKASQGPDQCETFDTCVAAILKLHQHAPKRAMTVEQIRLDTQLVRFDGAVPKLVDMLANPDIDRANIAASALLALPTLDSKYQPAISAAIDRGLDWAPALMGRVPDEAAAEETVKRMLASPTAPEDQYTEAVVLAGDKAVPFIVSAAQCHDRCDAHQALTLGQALRRMGAIGATAIPGLMAIAEDPHSTSDAARSALLMIGDLGQNGKPAEGRLVSLRAKRPELVRVIDTVLIDIRSSMTGKLFAKRLANGSALTFDELAETGPAGYDAGPSALAIMKRLTGEPRISAVRALGYIGYRAAVQDIIPLLKDPVDVRLNGAAAEALGRLGDRTAEPALRTVAQTHWFPPMRDLASDALQHLESGTPYPSMPGRPGGFAFSQLKRYSTCRLPTVMGGANVQLLVPGGVLMGLDEGEFAGGLEFRSLAGKDQAIFGENVVGLYKQNDQIVAVTNLSRMTINAGNLYHLVRSSDGRWDARLWRTLPEAPYGSRINRDGEIFVSMLSGYDILIDSRGSMRVSACDR